MKRIGLMMAVLFAVCVSRAFAQAGPGDPVAGQTEAQALQALGKPTGRIGGPAKTYLYYPRGKVTVQNGVVTAVELQNPVVFAAQQAVRAEDQAREDAKRGEQAGLLAVFVQNPSYLALPTRDRMLALERFHLAYPYANIRPEYQALQTIYSVERAETQKVEKLQTEVASAQAQAAAAQQQAAAAEQKAADAQKTAQAATTYNQGYGYAPVIYSPPPIQYIRIGNGTAVYVPPACPPVIVQRPPPSGVSLFINTPNFRLGVGSVPWAKANLPYNPARMN